MHYPREIMAKAVKTYSELGDCPHAVFGSLLNRFHMANCVIYITKMSTPYKTM